MAVNNVKVKNYKKHPDLELNLNGQNTFFVGDIGQGKTSILDLILAANMQKEFPTDPLTTGAEKGSVHITEELDGQEYIISRSFTKKDNGRWTVAYKDNKSGDKPPSLTVLLERIMKRALKNSFFDYTTYFFELKSPQARFDYIVKHSGNEAITKNLADKAYKVKKRAAISRDKNQQEAVYRQLGSLKIEDVPALAELYAKEKTQEDAERIYNEILSEQKEPDELEGRLNMFHHAAREKNNCLNSIDLNNIKISQLEERISLLKKTNASLQIIVDKSIATQELEDQLNQERQDLVTHNTEVEDRADKAFTEAVSEVIEFNGKRKDFIDSITALQAYNKLEAEWNTIDEEISKLEAENTALFKDKLPLPELGVSTMMKGEDVIDIVTYNGREFSFDNLSKGESIIIAAQIQNALNPGGNNFIVIPEANLLGSKLDDIIDECKKFKIQALVEVTQRKQDFKIIFEEEFFKS